MNYIPPAGQPIMASQPAAANGGQTETKPGKQQPKGRKKAHAKILHLGLSKTKRPSVKKRKMNADNTKPFVT